MNMPKKFWEARDRIKKIQKEKFAKFAERKKNKRLSDLFVKIHVYNKEVSVPIPNLYAFSEIERIYGSLEKVNFNNPKHLAEVLVILENQTNPKFDFMGKEERQELIVKRMQDIPAQQVQNYVLAIHEVFYGLKKNEIQTQKGMLENILAALDGGKLPATYPGKQELN